jgi:hypothetical protein
MDFMILIYPSEKVTELFMITLGLGEVSIHLLFYSRGITMPCRELHGGRMDLIFNLASP